MILEHKGTLWPELLVWGLAHNKVEVLKAECLVTLDKVIEHVKI